MAQIKVKTNLSRETLTTTSKHSVCRRRRPRDDAQSCATPFRACVMRLSAVPTSSSWEKSSIRKLPIHSYDYRPNWTPLSPITINNNNNNNNNSEAPAARRAPSGLSRGRKGNPCVDFLMLIMASGAPCLSWERKGNPWVVFLMVIMANGIARGCVGAYARWRRRRRRSCPTWRPYSKKETQPWFTVYFFDIRHPYYNQLTLVKTRYPLTSITW